MTVNDQTNRPGGSPNDSSTWAGVLSSMIVVCLAFVGCDSAFSPFTEQGPQPAHVLFGTLDASSDSQLVRVQIVRQDLAPVQPVLNELQLKSRVQGQDPISWNDSLVALPDGNQSHLFYTTQRPTPGALTTITVSGPDDRTTSISVFMPPKPDVRSGATEFRAGGIVKSVVLLGRIERPDQLSTEYDVFDPRINDYRRVLVPYNTSTGKRVLEGWEFVVNLSVDRSFVSSSLQQPLGVPVRLRDVSVLMTEFGVEWDNRSQTEIGFIGAIGRYSLPLVVEQTAIDTLNYVR